MTAVLPSAYLTDFIRMCAERRDVRVLNYHQLPWLDDWDFQNHYPAEYRRAFRSRPRDMIDVVIQYDVDSLPENTVQALEVHEECRVPANVMLRASRESADYHSWFYRFGELFALEQFALGYHCNAYVDADFVRAAVVPRMLSDLQAMGTLHKLTIDFMSPHGGRRDDAGKTNVHVLADLADDPIFQKVRWVHNKYGPRFDGVFSDGGLLIPAYSANRDLPAFVDTWKPGHRYRVLMHPQYYAEDHKHHEHLVEQEWYQYVMSTYSKGGNVWAPFS